MMFSLILPVYNVEKYISACVESCCRQRDIGYDEYEIILVDDNTPDHSIDVAISVLEKYPGVNYRIVRRPNGGLSAARNTGFANASGDYVWFIDSDDYIAEEALSVLKNAVISHRGVEVVSFGYYVKYDNRVIANPLPASCRFDILDRGIAFLRQMTFLSACTRIYSRRFLTKTGLMFTEGILWEDGEFNLKLLSITERHVCLDNCLYYYFRRPGSISTGRNVEKTLRSDLIIFDNHYSWLKIHDFAKDDRQILAIKIIRPVIFTLAGIPELSDKDLRKEIYREVADRSSHLSELASQSQSIKNQAVVFAIRVFPRFTSYLLYKKMQRLLAKDAAQLISHS